jgi:hypothetical protein
MGILIFLKVIEAGAMAIVYCVINRYSGYARPLLQLSAGGS